MSIESIGITQFIEWSKKPDYFIAEDEKGEREIKIAKLMLAMRDWAKFHNGDWNPTLPIRNQVKWLIELNGETLNVKNSAVLNTGIFQIVLKTEKLAEKMLKVFREELEEIKDWL